MNSRFIIASVLVLLSILVNLAAVAADDAVVFYVSPEGNNAWSGKLETANVDKTDGPFASVLKARNAIRTLKGAGKLDRPIHVKLRGGRHEMTETLVFTPDDSGSAQAPVSYEPYAGEKPVLSGGLRISGFKQGDKGIWSVNVPGGNGANFSFRQIAVNGERRMRPQLPKSGHYIVAGMADFKDAAKKDVYTAMNKFEFKAGDIRADWTNLRDIEIVVLHFWNDVHLPIESVDEAARIVSLTRKSRRRLTDDFQPQGARYIVDNVFEALAPGEFYFNKQTAVLHYMPKPGEDMQSAEVIVPRISELVRFDGTPENNQWVEHIALRGLTFSDNNWELPPNDSGNQQAAEAVPGAIVATGMKHCAIERCTLTNLSTYGVQLKNGCTENRLTRNEFVDLAAGGIRLTGAGGDPMSMDMIAKLPPGTIKAVLAETREKDLSIALGTSNAGTVANLLKHFPGDAAERIKKQVKPATGKDPRNDTDLAMHRIFATLRRLDEAGKVPAGASKFPADPKLIAQRTGKNVISDNHIHRLGRIYPSAVGILSMNSFGNTISHNHIHDLFYTGISVGWVWGYRPSASHSNVVEFNYIHDIGQKKLSDMGGIYMLGISTGTVVRNNVIHDVNSWSYGGWGIYTDEGSSDILIENNVVYRTKSGGFHQHYGKDNIVRNNVFAFAREYQVKRSREEAHNSFTFERNIVCYKDGVLLDGRWNNGNFKLQSNLYYNVSGKAPGFPGGSFEQWQKKGRDENSIIADPMFVDAANDNFALQPESPAFKLGFKPIDISSVGPRPE